MCECARRAVNNSSTDLLCDDTVSFIRRRQVFSATNAWPSTKGSKIWWSISAPNISVQSSHAVNVTSPDQVHDRCVNMNSGIPRTHLFVTVVSTLSLTPLSCLHTGNNVLEGFSTNVTVCLFRCLVRLICLNL